jgi:hypothetical protein
VIAWYGIAQLLNNPFRCGARRHVAMKADHFRVGYIGVKWFTVMAPPLA